MSTNNLVFGVEVFQMSTQIIFGRKMDKNVFQLSPNTLPYQSTGSCCALL